MSTSLIAMIIIVLLLAAILTKKMSPMIALIVIPLVGALITGHGFNTSKYVVDGIKTISPTVAMFVFAIIFFGVMNDAGMFDPIVNLILKVVGTNPVLVVMGTAVLAMITHLDGAGASTFLITIPAMLPLFVALKLDKRVLAAIVGLGAGVMNIVPWGGPTIRAMSALNSNVVEFFNPLIPVVGVGLVTVLIIAFFLGKREAKRIGYDKNVIVTYTREVNDAETALKRPKLFIPNIIITIAAITFLVHGKLAPGLVMMLAACIALLLNYPKVNDQKARVDAHAKSAIMMGSILIAAGAFMGIMKGAGFTKAMTASIVAFMPESLATHIPFAMGITSMPLSLLFDPDSFYYGILPVIADAASNIGVNPISVGQAAVLGQMTTGFPVSPLTASTFLLVGLTGVELSDHQKFAIPLAFLTTIVMVFAAVIFGVFPL